MNNVDERLIRCFSSVFPEMKEEGIRSADVARMADVDSLAAVTLLTVIDEEFGLDMDLESLLNLGSFQAVRQRLLESEITGVAPSDRRTK